jgi:hypothetical protein
VSSTFGHGLYFKLYKRFPVFFYTIGGHQSDWVKSLHIASQRIPLIFRDQRFDSMVKILQMLDWFDVSDALYLISGHSEVQTKFTKTASKIPC